ncbi:MAG: TldD/PmbA family protein [Bdellovibrionales bacterium]|nr:TldD/PmbA family protein [Bdellovibrionales bacterium]
MRNILQKTIDIAMSNGADSCDVILNSASSMDLSAHNGKLKKYKISQTSTLGIRVIKDKKIGLSYSESLDDDALLFTAKSALENAQYSSVNEYETINVKNTTDYVEEFGILDSSSTEERIEFALKLESEIKKRDARIQSAPYNGLHIGESAAHYLNSLGTYTLERENYLNAYTSSLFKVGEVTSSHYAQMLGRKLSDLNLEKAIDESILHSANWLEAKPVKTGKYDVVLDLEILQGLMSVFSHLFSAKEAIFKTNPWADKIGHAVAGSNFTLIDSPQYAEAFFKQVVDKEGTFIKDLTLIENGVLKSFYHNTATAKHFGVETTGHATRAPRGPLNVSGTNLMIRPGSHSESEVLADTYLEIIDVMGLGPGSDEMSGDFSFGASGYLCKEGKRILPVKGITVAGNYNKLLNSITRMGSELKSNHDQSFFAPLMRFSDLSVAGI